MAAIPKTLEVAVEHHRAGRFQQAEALYRQILQTDPNHADALHLLGLIAHHVGQHDIATDLIRKAIANNPGVPDFHNNIGLVFAAIGKPEEAIRAYQQTLHLKPDYAAAHFNMGNVLVTQGDFNAAIEEFNQALRVKPDFAEPHNNLGTVLQKQGRLDAAIEEFNQALRIKPDYAEAHYNMGGALHNRGELDAAIEEFNQALRVKPDYAEAYNNMGAVFQDRDNLNAATEKFNQALRVKPDFAEPHNNLGTVLQKQGRLDAAIEEFNQALRIKPDFAEACYNLGNALRDQGRVDAAIEMFDRTVRLNPDHIKVQFNRSFALLLSGNLTEGWKGYESRFQHRDWKITFPQRNEMTRWNGSSFHGKRLFVHGEQGFGDTLQFMRYLPMVKALGGTVIFGTKEPLLGLLQGFPGIDELVEQSLDGEPTLEFDLYVPLLSLPGIFGTALETIPAEVPYLYADSGKVGYWRGRLSGSSFKVGIVWAGRPGHKNDRNRSCALELFSPLVGIPGVELYGLQKGEAATQVESLLKEIIVINLGEEFEDFTDTAGAIENLDLVISVDTSVAHLAGAMGKPVWVLLPFAPDWRWLLDREDSPWYSTMRLFRQPKRGDWDDVFRRVAEELRGLAGKSLSETGSIGSRRLVLVAIPEALGIAMGHHRAGRLQQAEASCRQILQTDPNHADALHILGLIAHKTGRLHMAVDLIGKAIANNPRIPDFHNNIGLVFVALGEPEEAIRAYRQALLLKPDYAVACLNLGIALQVQGQLDTAIEEFEQALRLKPDFAEAYYNLGNALIGRGHLDASTEKFKKALRLKPDYAEAHFSLGNVLQGQGDFDAAIKEFNQALRFKSDFAEAYYNLGNALKRRGDLDAAIENFNQALRFKPDFAEAYNNLGNVLKDQGHIDAAIEKLNQALRFKPDHAEANFNLGTVLLGQGELDAAIEKLNQALRFKPDYADAYLNLGVALQKRGHVDAAIEKLNQAVRLKPDYAEAHLNRSMGLLLSGNFTEGWKGYESRFQHKDWKITFPQRDEMPRWDGSLFHDKRLFVHGEQGFGDTLQFVRYLPMVKARGGTVIFGTKEPLFGMLRGFPGIDELVEQSFDGKPTVEFDLYVPLLSLPGIFGTTLETIPAEVPYLYVDSGKVAYWRGRLSGASFKVGIVWSGRPGHKNDKNRSCALELFSPLAGIPGVELYGLQKGEAATHVESLSKEIIVTNLVEEFEDFTDTAGVIENLDLVISVDTSVAHLAGAMGKPVWVLLPFAPDWRWLLDREDSPWYPTMRLFRQPKQGDWDDVFRRVADDLCSLAGMCRPTQRVQETLDELVS